MQYSGEFPDFKRPGWRSIVRVLLVGAVGGAFTSLITAVVMPGYENGQTAPFLNQRLLLALYDFLPGFFIVTALEVGRLFWGELTHLTRQIGRLRLVTTDLNDKTEFNNYRESLLDCDPVFTSLMRDLVHESAIKNIRHVPRVSDDEFYFRLIAAVTQASVWEGVHQQEPHLLGLVTEECGEDGLPTRRARSARLYFEALRENQRRSGNIWRRIIILKDEEKKNFLADKDGWYTAFWKWNGEGVENYLISQRAAQEIARPIIINELDDCALHNKQLFLHYDRDRHTLLFDYGNDGVNFAEDIARAVKRLFEALDHHSGDFVKLKEPHIQMKANGR